MRRKSKEGKERGKNEERRGEVGKVQGKGKGGREGRGAKGRELVGLFGGVGFLMLQERREEKRIEKHG